MNCRSLLVVAALLAASLAGCRPPAVTFPPAAVAISPDQPPQTLAAYDTDGNGRADFYYLARGADYATHLGYDTDGDGSIDELIDLASIDTRQCRHLVIILDGFSYDVVQEYRASGGLRALPPPSRVVAPYPTMTDVSMEDLLNYIPARGIEGKFYDRRRQKMVGGAMAYLRGFNQPYNRLLDYRADLIWDVLGYVEPRAVFRREINDLKRTFDDRTSQEFIAYVVSSAGMGTRFGLQGQLDCLRDVDRLINQVVWETRGLTRVTLLSDHGHTYTACCRADLEGYLGDKGWSVGDKLRGPKSAVAVRFGLVNYASFVSDRKQELARDLAGHSAVTLASYAEGDSVVVLAGDRKAIIRRKAGLEGRAPADAGQAGAADAGQMASAGPLAVADEGRVAGAGPHTVADAGQIGPDAGRSSGERFSYESVQGDPLELMDALAGLKADADGYYDDADVLAATVDSHYPDPLRRLWRAHLALVQTPPDVIVSLANEYYFGLESFARQVEIASTHGSLTRSSSVTFAASNLGPLPPLMRSDQLAPAMGKLIGWPWPARR